MNTTLVGASVQIQAAVQYVTPQGWQGSRHMPTWAFPASLGLATWSSVARTALDVMFPLGPCEGVTRVVISMMATFESGEFGHKILEATIVDHEFVVRPWRLSI